MGMFSALRSFLSSMSSIMTRTSQDTSEPRPTPRNNYLFSNNSVVVGGQPGKLLEIFRRECEYLGVNLSLENRITKIEFCKSPDAPYHEFMTVYVSWVTPDGQLSDEYRCLLSAERFSSRPAGYEDIEAAQARTIPLSITSTSGVPGGVVSESTSQSPSVPVADKAAENGKSPRRPDAGVRAALTRSSRDSSRSSHLESDAWDVIRIHPTLKEPPRAVRNKATLTFPLETHFNVEKLACIMNVVHEEAPKYNALATQCYWFARCTWDIIVLMCAKESAEPLHDRAEMRMMGYWAYKYTGKMRLLPDNIRSPQLVKDDAKGPLLLESESASALLGKCKEECKYWENTFKESSQLRDKREEELMQLQAELAIRDARITELEAQLVAQSQ